MVPEPVITEIHGHWADDPTVKAISQVDWLETVAAPKIPREIADWELGPGEMAVLALAHADRGARAVIDDWDARHCAGAWPFR